MAKSKIDVTSDNSNLSQGIWHSYVVESTRNNVAWAMKRLDVQLCWENFEVVCDKSVDGRIRKLLKKFLTDFECSYDIHNLKQWEFIAYEIRREEKIFSKNVWILSRSGTAHSLNDIFPNFRWIKELEPRKMVTVLIVRKDRDNPWLLHISKEMIGCDREWEFNGY